MVQIERDHLSGELRFELTANGSMSSRQIVVFLCAAGVVMGTIAVGFTTLGLWLVIPFSGAEWLLLAYAFKLSLESSSVREVLTIGDSSVVLERGRTELKPVHRFQRTWLAVVLNKPKYRGHPSQLILRSHGRQVEVGGFLVEAEREMLERELRKLF